MTPAPIELGRVTPILRIFDVPKAREFYLGFLGFAWDWEHRFEPQLPLYAQVSRGGAILHLSEHHGDSTPGSALIIEITGLDAFHTELTAAGYGYARPGIEDAPWDARLVRVTDPFGNRLTFSEPKPA